MKRYALWAAAAGVAAVLVAPSSAAAPPGSASILIRHQLRGCHTWSLNGGAYRAELDLRLARGGSVTITNNDPMVHKLIRERGPAVRMRTVPHAHMKMVGLHRITGPGVMNHMGAALKVTFPRAGTYRFTTEDLGDYFELKSLGHHNHLDARREGLVAGATRRLDRILIRPPVDPSPRRPSVGSQTTTGGPR